MAACFENLSEQQQLDHLEAVARRALPAWGITSDAFLKLLSLSENATYLVKPESSDTPVILRVHRTGYHSRTAIESELAWMAALQNDAGIRTPQFIAAENGEALIEIETPELNETRFAALFEFIEGEAPDESALTEPFKRLGAITARLHLHAREWQRPEPFERLIWDFDGCLGQVKLWGDWSDAPGLDDSGIAVLNQVEQVLGDRLSRWGKSPDRFGLIHSDLRLANLLEVDGDTRVIDFDDAGFGWFLYDLASAVSFIETREDLPELIDAWVQGYQTITPLTPADIAEIPTFILLRRMTLLAWIGSHGNTELAQQQGAAFAKGTAALAGAYLDSLERNPDQPALTLPAGALL